MASSRKTQVYLFRFNEEENKLECECVNARETETMFTPPKIRGKSTREKFPFLNAMTIRKDRPFIEKQLVFVTDCPWIPDVTKVFREYFIQKRDEAKKEIIMCNKFIKTMSKEDRKFFKEIGYEKNK